tara:strand:- start:43 stop:291 length:249 start_codon:yes stop_codon:yes gene_type:complete
MATKIDWKKVLQAGAYATDALSKGSAGGLGKAIVDSKIDLSGKSSNGDKETNGEYKKNGKQRNVQIQNGDDRLEVNDTNYLQ